MADFHLDKNFTVKNSLIERGNSGNREYFLGDYKYDICWENGGEGMFGDYDCDSSLELIDSAVTFIKTYTELEIHDGQAKFVLWTG